MDYKRSFFRMKSWFIPLFFLIGCMERINFDVPLAKSQLVIEGMISDSPGPYTVKVSEGIELDVDSIVNYPVQKVKIKLFDDEGNTEDFTETDPGTYITGGGIQGKNGHAYHIRLETPDGRILESEPDSITPVGEVQDIRYEFEARTREETYGEVKADVFNVFIDSYAGAEVEKYIRWRYTGTYKVLTNPELRKIWSEGFLLQDPLPCSGYVVSPGTGGGNLQKVSECSCCTCWVNQYEAEPKISDGELITNNQFKNLKIAEVPINPATFYDKFLIEIEQMSLTRKAYDFFKLIRTQKEGVSSLFQPPSGEITGNIKTVNYNGPVIGLFYATSISTKSLFIKRSEVPYNLLPIYFVTEACTKYYPNASIKKPALWE